MVRPLVKCGLYAQELTAETMKRLLQTYQDFLEIVAAAGKGNAQLSKTLVSVTAVKNEIKVLVPDSQLQLMLQL